MMSRTPSNRSIVMNSNTHAYRMRSTNTSSHHTTSRASMMIRSLSMRGDMTNRTPPINGRAMSRSSSIKGGSMMTKSLSIRDIDNKQTAPSSSIMSSLHKSMSFRWTNDSEEKND